MGYVIFEEEAFEAMAAKFDYFVSRMENICRNQGDRKIDKWMDNQDVCLMLNISPRTLQTLRDNGTWRTAKSTTRPTTSPKTCSVLCRW